MDNRVTQRILYCIGLLVLALPGIRTISHSEFWTHLASGRWIVQNGFVPPRTDPLTWVKADAEWVNPSWLYDLLVYGLWQAGGATLVTLTHVVVVLAAFGLLIPVARRWAGPLAITYALILSAWLLAPRFEARPMILALFFPALFVFILSGYTRTAVLFPVLLAAQLFWTNIHGSFIAGPFISLLFVVQAYARGKGGLLESATLSSEHKLLLNKLAALTGGLVLISAVNPYLLGPHLEAFRALVNIVVSEWISPFSEQFRSLFARHMVTLALIIGAGGLLAQKQKLPIALTVLAVLSAFMVVRSMPGYIHAFTLLAFPFFCLSIEAVGRYLANIFFKTDRAQQTAGTALVGVAVLLAVVSAAGVVSNRYYTGTGSTSSFGWGAVTGLYPESAAHIIEHPDFPERAINLPMDGGYLAWRFPERKIFMDQRIPLYGLRLYGDLAAGLMGEPTRWNAILNEWNPEAVILSGAWPNSAEAIRHLRQQDRWEMLYFDGTTAILLLNISANAGLLRNKAIYLEEGLQQIEEARKDYRARLGGFRHPPIPARLIGAANVFYSVRQYHAAAVIYELLTRGAPRMLTPPVYLGICQAQMGRHAEALRILPPAVEALPPDSRLAGLGHLNIGISLAHQEQFEEALNHLKRAADIHPGNPMIWLWMGRIYGEQGRTQEARAAFERAREIDPSIRLQE